MSEADLRRLLLVTHRPLDYGGGGSVRWRYLVEHLPALGWHVDVVSARHNPTANEFSSNPTHTRLSNARARVMGTAGRLARPVAHAMGVQPEAFPPSMAWALTGRRVVRRAVAEKRPHVVLATVPPAAAMFAAAAGAGDTPLVTEFRDLWAGDPYYDAGGRALTKLEASALERSAAVVCVTPEAGERLRELHPGIDVEVLPNGFDPRLLEMRRSEAAPQAGERKLTMIHAGAVYGGRSLTALAEALAQPDLQGRFRLELVGTVDPAERHALDQSAAGLEIDVSPPLEWDQAVQRVLGAHVVLVVAAPDHDSAVPGKLYEALALGKPTLVIAAPGSATSRVMTQIGREGACARFGDRESIAAAVRNLVNDPQTPLSPDELAPWNRQAVAERMAALLERVS